MNILILHNNNLPLPIRPLFNHSSGNLYFKSEVINKRDSDKDEYDTFLDKVLSSKMDQEYALIILPISLNELNPLEYSGLRCAAHIRLDKRFKNMRTPILFLAPEGIEEVLRLSTMGEFLLTPAVYLLHCNTKESLIEWIETNWAQDDERNISDDEYNSFLNRFIVKAPKNFADEHHSITNIWTILRWNEMLQRTDSAEPFLSEDVKDFSCSLYYKWLQARQSTREHFRQKKKETPFIGTIAEKKIIHIDDDIDRGLGDVLENIFRASKASYFPYKDFDSRYTKEELETRIKAFIDENDDADCYLIDLRLHETDNIPFDENNDEVIKDLVKSFTGHIIARYIYEKNPGNQIVIFTASNKIWNYVAAEEYFSGYVIKENPEFIISKAGSRSIFMDFANAIQKACKNSFLRKYYSLCKDVPYLDDFFEILRQDDEKDVRSHMIFLRSLALNLVVFIESTIKTYFSIEGYTLKKGDVDVANVFSACIQCDFSSSPILPLHFGSYDGLLPCAEGDIKWSRIVDVKGKGGKQKITDIGLICVALNGFYSVSNEGVDRVIRLKNIRNQSIAHAGQQIGLDIKLIRDTFDSVIIKMLNKKV